MALTLAMSWLSHGLAGPFPKHTASINRVGSLMSCDATLQGSVSILILAAALSVLAVRTYIVAVRSLYLLSSAGSQL